MFSKCAACLGWHAATPRVVVVMPAGGRTCCPSTVSMMQSQVSGFLLMGHGAVVDRLRVVCIMAVFQGIVHDDIRVPLRSEVQTVLLYLYSAAPNLQHFQGQIFWTLLHLQVAGDGVGGEGRGGTLNWSGLLFKCMVLSHIWRVG